MYRFCSFLFLFFPSVNSSQSTTRGLLHHWPPLSPPPLLLPSPRIAPFVIPITLCHYIHILIVPLSSFLLLSSPSSTPVSSPLVPPLTFSSVAPSLFPTMHVFPLSTTVWWNAKSTWLWHFCHPFPPPPPHLNVMVSYVLVSSALINIQCVWYVAWLF